MTKEEQLKSFILTKYKSLREFTQESGIPYSTMSTILKRGIDNSNVTNIIKICQALSISADELAAGRIVPIKKADDEICTIEDILENTKQKLLTTDNLVIEDHPATAEDVMFIINALDTAIEMRKRQNERLMAYANKIKKDDSK